MYIDKAIIGFILGIAFTLAILIIVGLTVSKKNK